MLTSLRLRSARALLLFGNGTFDAPIDSREEEELERGFRDTGMRLLVCWTLMLDFVPVEAFEPALFA